MYFKSSGRTNPCTKQYDRYYRLVESYRNETGSVCHRTILNVGFLGDIATPEQLNHVSRTLTDRYQRKQSLFSQADSVINNLVEDLWGKIVSEKRLDLSLYEEKSRMIHADTLQHSHVREVGAEWMCYNTWNLLGINKVLEDNDFSDHEIRLAQTQVISRAVNPASELATSKWIHENSAVSELTEYDLTKMNKDRLYKSALKLDGIKEKLERHLSQKTNELFDIQDKIILYDLTNTYFEGEKRNSTLAKYGRSKEKRKDAKLVVLALVVNIYGFIKHSSIHEGNFCDTTDVEKIIDSLNHLMGDCKPVIVLDAGISTKENLEKIRSSGYHYLCVSRTKLKNYKFDATRTSVHVETSSKSALVLKKILTEDNTDYVLEITSERKAQKEEGMKIQFEARYEEELAKIKSSLTKKGGVKASEKVNQRIGRSKGKYPSAQGRYSIELIYDEKKETVLEMTWTKNETKNTKATENLGKYFIRTSMEAKDEKVVWNIYNTIREIESTFKTLKTDLDLRPIYHKKDESTIAHLNLGLLAYWLVNTIRQQLKSVQINHSWKEIVRIGNTQKIITTTGYNKAEKEIFVRKCSEPDAKLKALYQALGIKQKPFTKIKSVVHKPKPKNLENTVLQTVMSA
jgi:transposase